MCISQQVGWWLQEGDYDKMTALKTEQVACMEDGCLSANTHQLIEKW